MNRFDFLEIEKGRRLPRGRPPSATTPGAPEPEPAAATPQWQVVELIGGPGAAVGQFASPGGLAVDGRGNLYVADSYNHRIQRISPEGDVFAIGRHGSRLGEFLNPQAVAVAPDSGQPGGGRIYVLEQGNHRIQLFDADGTPVAAWGGQGLARDCFNAPMGLAIDPAGNLYVADTGNNRLVRWSAAGKPIAVLDAATAGAPAFGKPQGVCVDQAGVLFVADTLRHEVLVFDAGMRLLDRIGAPGDGPGALAEPQDAAIDAAGHLFIAEAGNHRLQILDRAGRSLQCLDRAGSLGRLNTPAGVAAALNGDVYLADTGNHRIFLIRPTNRRDAEDSERAQRRAPKKGIETADERR